MNPTAISEMTTELHPQRGPSSLTDRQVLRALILHQWLPVRRLHAGFFITWLIGLWVLLLMTHPGWLIAFGVLYTIVVTPAVAGGDVVDGTEEFSFSLPPGRGALFLARMGIGLVFLLLTTGVGGLAIALDLPQAFWSLFASSGITKPNPPVEPAFLYPLAVLAPLAAYAVTFTLACLAGSRGQVGLTWLGGALAAGLLILFGLQAERLMWNQTNGWLTCVLLLLTTVLVLLAGYLRYQNKEAVTGAGRLATKKRGLSVLMVLMVLGLLALLMMSLFWVQSVDVESSEVRALEEARSEVLHRAPGEVRVLRQTIDPNAAEQE